MLSDDGKLLRALLYVQTETARRGFDDASDRIAQATQIVISNITENKSTIVSDDTLSVLMKMSEPNSTDTKKE